ncbi:MAG: NAD-dependent epimerase/dehydratase family protein [Desulfobulbaceae bacterium]|nr:NAD-dependent epimerase/dehydratase family protein [Desulfobulbaceae bacterium]
MAPTIALTGATGFIGGTVLAWLIGAGYRVRALVRPASLYKCRHLPAAVEWISGDCTEDASVRLLLTGADAAVHCAGVVRGATPNAFNRVNVDGTACLVQNAAALANNAKILLLSSLAAREPRLSPYAASKLAGEEALRHHGGDFFWGIFRPAAVYGPGDRELLPFFQAMFRGVAPVIGLPSNRVSMLHVDDLAAAILAWLRSPGPNHGVYEVHDGHSQGYSWREIIDIVASCRGKRVVRMPVPVSLLQFLAQLNLAVARLSGRAPMLTPWKVQELLHNDWVADNAALEAATGWRPTVSLAAGIRQTMGLA